MRANTLLTEAGKTGCSKNLDEGEPSIQQVEIEDGDTNERSRLSVIYRIINMLFYFEPGSNCRLPADLLLAPLPARKELWEADSELVWKSEREAKARPQVEFGLASTGDLVRLGQDRSEEVLVHTAITSQTPMRTSANWEEWCEGMDGFGGIVMLAASMAV